VRVEQSPIWAGISPVREFFPSLSTFNDFPPTVDGILPVSLLALKSSTSSDFISTMLAGTLPDRELQDMFNDCKLSSFEISDGMCPENELLDRSTP
jgi:hypothetical protein